MNISTCFFSKIRAGRKRKVCTPDPPVLIPANRYKKIKLRERVELLERGEKERRGRREKQILRQTHA